MSTELNIRMTLLRAELRAFERLEALRPATASTGYREHLSGLEEAYATACAVRRYWEECEQRASPENKSDDTCTCVGGRPHHFPYCPKNQKRKV